MRGRLINMLKFLRLGLLLAVSVFFLTACGSGAGSDAAKNSSVPEVKKLTLVTSFYPMYIATINVTKNVPGVEVVNLTKPQTGCLHDYQLLPEDVKTLEKADLFVINGAGMENFLDKVIKQRPNLIVVDSSKDIPILMDEFGHEHEDEEHAHETEEHEHGVPNPHLWVSVANAILQAKNIGTQLAVADPAHAEQYKHNTEVYVQKLEALRAKMHAALDGLPHRDIVTFHEAFPYFAQEFGLHISAVIEREPGTQPSPQELAQTIDIIKETGVKALFAEPQYPAKAADAIAEATGAKVYILDPAVTGEAKPDAYDDYINIMEKNTLTLKEALQ